LNFTLASMKLYLVYVLASLSHVFVSNLSHYEYEATEINCMHKRYALVCQLYHSSIAELFVYLPKILH